MRAKESQNIPGVINSEYRSKISKTDNNSHTFTARMHASEYTINLEVIGDTDVLVGGSDLIANDIVRGIYLRQKERHSLPED